MAYRCGSAAIGCVPETTRKEVVTAMIFVFFKVLGITAVGLISLTLALIALDKIKV